MKQSLYSAPNEEYKRHIELCLEKFELVFPLFSVTLKRVLSISDEKLLKEGLTKMVKYHDLGKLTKRWQENVGTGKSLPSHSNIGACYLWKILPEGLKEPLSFAVIIHHTDRGLLGDNIERPDVQAIIEGIVNEKNGIINWHKAAKNLEGQLFPEVAENMSVNDLKEMARGLRIWAKGCTLLEQHQRRLQASLAHHILKLCDISAAIERKEYQKKDEQDYYGGWLMVEEIRDYVENISVRKEVI
ncbi:CRISPR-associated endonuclease Cas3'' [Bacteroidetes/Chlorobi group bacterium Naka2016]|jgi:CRISPR-associated endonuclease Cas3-HD|nr:MAG: CRISPR-associated endonuclease Cas3'' [Bacteroidetes/Chlorobi group bacterium Naka2016]